MWLCAVCLNRSDRENKMQDLVSLNLKKNDEILLYVQLMN